MMRRKLGAERASKALQAGGYDLGWNGVSQFLTDLRHLCDANNLDLDDLEAIGYNHAMANDALDREDERKAELKWQTQ